jgi:hypothetical protein
VREGEGERKKEMEGYGVGHYGVMLSSCSVLNWLTAGELQERESCGGRAVWMGAVVGEDGMLKIVQSKNIGMGTTDNGALTPLLLSLLSHHPTTALLLLQRPDLCGDINASNENQLTPLHLAAGYNDTHLVGRVVGLGAKGDVGAEHEGSLAIDLGCERGAFESVECVIS